MKCRKCGSELPKNAVFCYECGTRARGKGGAAQPVLLLTKKKLAVISAIAAAVLIVLISMIVHYRAESEYRVEDIQVSDGQYSITLTGKFVVGEDELLPPGIYNISPVPGGKEFSVEVTGEDGYWDYLYVDKDDGGRVLGYRLKRGYLVDTKYRGATFTLVTELEKKTEPSEASGTSENTQEPSEASGTSENTQEQ